MALSQGRSALFNILHLTMQLETTEREKRTEQRRRGKEGKDVEEVPGTARGSETQTGTMQSIKTPVVDQRQEGCLHLELRKGGILQLCL